jgi:hypothetical protein
MLVFLAGFMLGVGVACVAIASALFKLATSASAAKPFAPVLPIEQRPVFVLPEVGVA